MILNIIPKKLYIFLGNKRGNELSLALIQSKSYKWLVKQLKTLLINLVSSIQIKINHTFDYLYKNNYIFQQIITLLHSHFDQNKNILNNKISKVI